MKRKIRLKRGFLITFEGIEAAGKGTLIEPTVSYLKNNGFDVIAGREPGTTEISEKIREIIQDSRNKGKMDLYSELGLFCSARAQYVHEFIKPNLEKSKIVVSDRYSDSSYAYQGFGRCKDKKERRKILEQITFLNKAFTQGIQPDLTFIIDIPVELSLRRLKQTRKVRSRIEQEPKDFHKRLRSGYIWVASNFGERCKWIDNSSFIHYAIQDIKDYLDEFLEDIKKYYK